MAVPVLVASSEVVPAFIDEESIPILDDAIIESVNSRNIGWTAGRNNRFEGVSIAAAKRLLGVVIPGSAVNCPAANASLDVSDLPDSLDTRTKWPNFIHPVRDQARCGSCWAFAASEVLSDRLAIYSNGAKNFVLSPQGLVSCDTVDHGCGGGWPTDAAKFLVSTGIPTDVCEPYASAGGAVPTCPATCADGSAKTLYKYQSWSYAIGEQAMIAALQTGPIAVAFAVHSDFFQYKSGVYNWDNKTGLAGYHAVKVIGYGKTADATPLPYWIVQNSWGPAWGEAGTFRIARGSNMCGMELGALDKGCPLYGVPLVQEEIVV